MTFLNNRIWFVPAVLVFLGIFLLSTFLALPIQVEGVSGIDKWEHAFAYMVLIVTFLYAFKKNKRLTNRIKWFILVLGGMYGFLLELVQYFFFSYRFFEWYDALANLTGALLGFLIFTLLKGDRNG